MITSDSKTSVQVVRSQRGDPDLLADLAAAALEDASSFGMGELRAAAALVSEGHAVRVTLANFAVWPGLLTEIERLSREFDLSILPAMVRPGGRVDLIVSRGSDGY